MQNQNSPLNNMKSFWPLMAVAVISAIVGGAIVYFVYNQGLDQDVSNMLPGNNFRHTTSTPKALSK